MWLTALYSHAHGFHRILWPPEAPSSTGNAKHPDCARSPAPFHGSRHVLPEGVKVSILVITSHEAVLSVDGHPPVVVMTATILNVPSPDYRLRMVRLKDPGYFYRNITLYMEHNPALRISYDTPSSNTMHCANHREREPTCAVIVVRNHLSGMRHLHSHRIPL
jgi:hypothetical protein